MDKLIAIPTYILERLLDYSVDSIEELTPILVGDSIVYENEECEVIDIDYKKNENGIDSIEAKVTIKSYDTKEELTVDRISIDIERDGWLPSYKTMWSFNDTKIKQWVKRNPEFITQLGFRVYEDYRYDDIYIGLDLFSKNNITENDIIENYLKPLCDVIEKNVIN